MDGIQGVCLAVGQGAAKWPCHCPANHHRHSIQQGTQRNWYAESLIAFEITIMPKSQAAERVQQSTKWIKKRTAA
jgi:hypothetical protein